MTTERVDLFFLWTIWLTVECILELLHERARNLENLSTTLYALYVNCSFWSYQISHTFGVYQCWTEEIFTALKKVAGGRPECIVGVELWGKCRELLQQCYVANIEYFRGNKHFT